MQKELFSTLKGEKSLFMVHTYFRSETIRKNQLFKSKFKFRMNFLHVNIREIKIFTDQKFQCRKYLVYFMILSILEFLVRKVDLPSFFMSVTGEKG